MLSSGANGTYRRWRRWLYGTFLRDVLGLLGGRCNVGRVVWFVGLWTVSEGVGLKSARVRR